MRTCNNRGFTLIEGIVAVAISSVLAMVLLTILRMNNDGVKNGAANAHVQSQYEIAIAEIGKSTRGASAVLNHAGTPETYPPAASLTAVSTSEIEMDSEKVDGTGTAIRRFKVESGQLKEWRPGWSDYKSFTVGAWATVSVPDATPFQLSADRNTLTVSMSVTGTFSGVTAVALARREVFTCRN